MDKLNDWRNKIELTLTKIKEESALRLIYEIATRLVSDSGKPEDSQN